MKWLRALLLLLLIPGLASAQGVPGQSWTNAVLNAPNAATPGPTDVVPIIQGGVTKQLPYSQFVPAQPNTASAVAALSALQLACTVSSGCPFGSPVFTGGLWRNTYGNGNGSGPLFYTPSNSACSLNAGAGDNGSQVSSANGKCWLAVFPDSGINPLQFGAMCNNSGNDQPPVQAAFDASARLAQRASITGLCAVPGGVTYSGNYNAIVGSGISNGLQNTGNNSVTLTLSGSHVDASHFQVFGYNSTAATLPSIEINSSTEDHLTDVLAYFGTGILVTSSDTSFINVSTAYSYGSAIVRVFNSGGEGEYFYRTKRDQNNPYSGAIIIPAASSFAAWAPNTTYSQGAVVSDPNCGTGACLIQVMIAGTSLSSGTGPTVTAYQVNIPDGSGSLVWQMLAPAEYYALQISGDSSAMINDIGADDVAPTTAAVELDSGSSLVSLFGGIYGGFTHGVWIRSGGNVMMFGSFLQSSLLGNATLQLDSGATLGATSIGNIYQNCPAYCILRNGDSGPLVSQGDLLEGSSAVGIYLGQASGGSNIDDYFSNLSVGAELVGAAGSNVINGTFDSVTTKISNSSTGTKNVFGRGIVTATTSSTYGTASGSTYTASPAGETDFLTGGTVSSVTVGGHQVCSSTPCTVPLPPNGQMVVTYSVAPTNTVYVQ